MNDQRQIEHEVVPQGTTSVIVWDPIVRPFHWSVVLGCVLNLFVLDPSGAAHRYIGYGVAVALLVRLVWGFVGTRYARFSDFTPSRRALVEYTRDLRHGRERRFLGHNPAGAVMMLVLMALLAAVSATGWMLGLDVFWGNETLFQVHQTIANSILVLALLHAGAAVIESWRHNENLIWSMVTGRKRK